MLNNISLMHITSQHFHFFKQQTDWRLLVIVMISANYSTSIHNTTKIVVRTMKEWRIWHDSPPWQVDSYRIVSKLVLLCYCYCHPTKWKPNPVLFSHFNINNLLSMSDSLFQPTDHGMAWQLGMNATTTNLFTSVILF